MSRILANGRSSALVLSRRQPSHCCCSPSTMLRRTAAMATATATPSSRGKKEGDISSVFVSLSGAPQAPLPDRYRVLKQSLVAGHEDAVIASWHRLLAALRRENDIVAAKGSAVLPSVEFRNLRGDLRRLRDEIQHRGAAVIRGVVDEHEARAYKDEVEAYVAQNPQTKGVCVCVKMLVDVLTHHADSSLAFPANNPQVYELYWSAAQLRARSHANVLATQVALMQELWTVGGAEGGRGGEEQQQQQIGLEPLSYADRVRIRQPGDAQFALGPHVDGGSVERWEREGYGRGGVYDAVFRGDWEAYDPWAAGPRINAVTDRYEGAGACSMFRMFQAWLSASCTGPNQGTLLLNPLLRLSTVYLLLRPFFAPVGGQSTFDKGKGKDNDGDDDRLFDPNSWSFVADSSELQGASPGHSQELNDALHPHLQLGRTMVHVPDIRPGDYVIWHCDQIHAVDPVHNGSSDSSVLYIPVCPTTPANLRYLGRQRAAFHDGIPPPDFPGGRGEADHVNRPGQETIASADGMRAMGLLPSLDVGGLGLEANKILGF